MATVLLIIHLFVTLALIGVVLIQRSEGGGLCIGTTQGMGGFMSGRGTTNLLTRTTAILGTAFFALSLTLALLNRGTVGGGRSLLDSPPVTGPASSGPASSGPASSGPAIPGAATPGPATSGPAAPGDATPAPAPKGPAVPTN